MVVTNNSQRHRLIGVYFSIVAVFIAAYWDSIMDWGLNRIQMRNYLGFGTWIVCFFNLLLRFLNSVPLESKTLAIISNVHLLNSLEILRRSVWTDIRIKNYIAQQDI